MKDMKTRSPRIRPHELCLPTVSPRLLSCLCAFAILVVETGAQHLIVEERKTSKSDTVVVGASLAAATAGFSAVAGAAVFYARKVGGRKKLASTADKDVRRTPIMGSDESTCLDEGPDHAVREAVSFFYTEKGDNDSFIDRSLHLNREVTRERVTAPTNALFQ